MDKALLIGLPLAVSILAMLINSETPVTAVVSILLAVVTAVVVSVASTALVAIVGNFKILDSGFDTKDWTLRLTFVSTFLLAFYASTVIIGLNLILSVPLGLGLIMQGVLVTLFALGVFDYAAGSTAGGAG